MRGAAVHFNNFVFFNKSIKWEHNWMCNPLLVAAPRPLTSHWEACRVISFILERLNKHLWENSVILSSRSMWVQWRECQVIWSNKPLCHSLVICSPTNSSRDSGSNYCWFCSVVLMPLWFYLCLSVFITSHTFLSLSVVHVLYHCLLQWMFCVTLEGCFHIHQQKVSLCLV